MIVVACGLHGGAGTTTVATLLAQATARQHPHRVLLCDASPGAGDLALAYETASSSDLNALALLIAEQRTPTVVPWLDLVDGVRLLARGPEPRPAAPPAALATALRDANSVHDLVVVDAGALAAPAAASVLPVADLVLWTLDAGASLRRCAHLLSGQHSVPARHAPWLLAVSATGRQSQPVASVQLAALVPSAARHVHLPHLGGIAADDPARELARGNLLSALT